MKISAYSYIPGIILVITGCATLQPQPLQVYEGPFLVSAEDSIPGVPPEVKFADFWIRTASNPDDLILSPDEVETFNKENPMNGDGIIDVLNLPAEIDGARIRQYIASNARYLIGATLYVTADIPLEAADRHRIAALMDTSGVPDVIPLKFGVMLRREQGKVWPTMIPLTKEPNDNEFDQAAGSALDMGDPVALLHVSHDGQWSYVQNSMYTCWIHSDAVAFGDIGTVREITDRSAPVVAVGHRVSVYATPEGGAAVGAIQMGSYLPVRTAGKDFFEVLIPSRGENNELVGKRGYIRRSSDVSLGFLPYTLRNVYRQCFALYGRRYGWAGMFEERDCSQFVMDVFKCFGFRLPAFSLKQLQASKCVLPLDQYDRAARAELMNSSPGGITFIGWSGHIMIYLGSVGNTPYVIHDFWAWRTPTDSGKDVTHRVARVAVSDLMLGEGSSLGAMIDRIQYLSIMGNYTITDTNP